MRNSKMYECVDDLDLHRGVDNGEKIGEEEWDRWGSCLQPRCYTESALAGDAKISWYQWVALGKAQ